MNSHIYYSENKVIRFFCGIQLIIKTCSTNHKILHVTLNMQLKLTIRQSDNENQKKIHEDQMSPMLLRETVESLYFNLSPWVKLLLK